METSYKIYAPFALKVIQISPATQASPATQNEISNENPRKWGPYLWRYLHLAAACYPQNATVDDQRAMIEWLHTLPVTIPCHSCRMHYTSYIYDNGDALREAVKTRDKLFEFFVILHNWVNKRTGKKPMDLAEAKLLYKCI